MKAPVCGGSVYSLLRLGLLGLLFVCGAHSLAEAQTCSGFCVIYAGDNAGGSCFTTNVGEASCPANPFTSHVTFGSTVDFYQPSNIPFGAHTTTSGNCCSGTNGFFRAPASGFMASQTDYTFTFDGHATAGGNLNAGTYNYYCEPHGSGMKGVLIVDQDSTSSNLTNPSNPTSTSVVNQPVNGFLVTVSNTQSGVSITPSGQVRLLIDGFAVTGFQSLSGGQFTFNGITFSSSGDHNVTVQFQDPIGNFVSNTSNTLVWHVQDFSINITNPAGAALPGQNYDYSGTLTAINGYSAPVNITCTGGTPQNCALFGATNPVPMGSPFTVRANHPSPQPTFNFNIQAASASGFSDIHSFPVTLNVGSFNFTALNPSSVNVARGNSSAAMAFQVISTGGFSGEVDMSCPTPPAGVTCIFSNGAATQALFLAAGQTINDTLVLDTNNSVALGANPVTVQATPVAAPGQFQTHTVTLNESAPVSAYLLLSFADTNTVTVSSCNGFPGTYQPGTCLSHNFPPPVFMGVGGVSEPTAVGVVNSSGRFVVSAYNGEASQNSDSVQLNLVFDHPVVFSPPPSIYYGGFFDFCTVVSSIQVHCNLNTITAAAPWIKTVVVSVKPLFYRSLSLTATMSESESNPAAHVIQQTVQVRPRPFVHNKVPPKIP